MHKHLSLLPAQPRRSRAHNMASPSELQDVRAKIEKLEEKEKVLNAQIAAADPSERPALRQELILQLSRLDTLQKKEERLAAQLSAGERPGQKSQWQLKQGSHHGYRLIRRG